MGLEECEWNELRQSSTQSRWGEEYLLGGVAYDHADSLCQYRTSTRPEHVLKIQFNYIHLSITVVRDIV